jgi:hypothetical protein
MNVCQERRKAVWLRARRRKRHGDLIEIPSGSVWECRDEVNNLEKWLEQGLRKGNGEEPSFTLERIIIWSLSKGLSDSLAVKRHNNHWVRDVSKESPAFVISWWTLYNLSSVLRILIDLCLTNVAHGEGGHLEAIHSRGAVICRCETRVFIIIVPQLHVKWKRIKTYVSRCSTVEMRSNTSLW